MLVLLYAGKMGSELGVDIELLLIYIYVVHLLA
jgi:hypothetical protein